MGVVQIEREQVMNEQLTTVTQGLSGDEALSLLTLLSSWQNVTTIMIKGGCVFEYKGVFPAGSLGQGYFNFGGDSGFHGHIRLEAIGSIGFQDRQHRGRDSFAFLFDDTKGRNIFKVFLGRDESGDLHPEQVAAFNRIRETGKINPLLGVEDEEQKVTE
jgi:hypothetical protein